MIVGDWALVPAVALQGGGGLVGVTREAERGAAAARLEQLENDPPVFEEVVSQGVGVVVGEAGRAVVVLGREHDDEGVGVEGEFAAVMMFRCCVR
jgi:hypothetical protein